MVAALAYRARAEKERTPVCEVLQRYALVRAATDYDDGDDDH